MGLSVFGGRMRLAGQVGKGVVHHRECKVWMSDWQKLEEVEARVRPAARAASAVDGSRRHVSRASSKDESHVAPSLSFVQYSQPSCSKPTQNLRWSSQQRRAGCYSVHPWGLIYQLSWAVDPDMQVCKLKVPINRTTPSCGSSVTLRRASTTHLPPPAYFGLRDTLKEHQTDHASFIAHPRSGQHHFLRTSSLSPWCVISRSGRLGINCCGETQLRRTCVHD